jgi:hypothetical protein
MGPVQFFRFDDNIWTGLSLSLFQKWQKDRTELDFKALASRAHDPAGIDAPLNGELMVKCLACPHPGRNLSSSCENAGPLL